MKMQTVFLHTDVLICYYLVVLIESRIAWKVSRTRFLWTSAFKLHKHLFIVLAKNLNICLYNENANTFLNTDV